MIVSLLNICGVLERSGCGRNFTKLVQALMVELQLVFTPNEGFHGKFSCNPKFGRGCLLAPLLYAIASVLLISLFQHAAKDGYLPTAGDVQGTPVVIAMFADDVTLFLLWEGRADAIWVSVLADFFKPSARLSLLDRLLVRNFPSYPRVSVITRMFTAWKRIQTHLRDRAWLWRLTFQAFYSGLKTRHTNFPATACTACGEDPETVSHLLFMCNGWQQLWSKWQMFLPVLQQYNGQLPFELLRQAPHSASHLAAAYPIIYTTRMEWTWRCQQRYDHITVSPSATKILVQALDALTVQFNNVDNQIKK
ncbi:hypothetical protein R1sor_002209 [Riccia sorocarpa]|uniref:Reverse transcriptase zinc-binding domain-containing protein n=1 Tax=Riccia sorocarpa TaxID=122646 RepID=A0ABD3H185_9MARC